MCQCCYLSVSEAEIGMYRQMSWGHVIIVVTALLHRVQSAPRPLLPAIARFPRKVRQATSAPSLFPTWTVPRKQMWNLKTSLVWRSKSQRWERVENIVNILLVWAYNSAFAKSINSSFQVQFDRIYACLFRKWPFGGFVLNNYRWRFRKSTCWSLRKVPKVLPSLRFQVSVSVVYTWR